MIIITMHVINFGTVLTSISYFIYTNSVEILII